MTTECTPQKFLFQDLRERHVVAAFDGGQISSDGGAVLLREVERRCGIIKRFAQCFTDHRAPALIEHSVEDLVAQRIYGLALGYEDLNDHDQLRSDPLLATVVGKADPSGQQRIQARDEGKALAGKSTLNRLELTPQQVGSRERYKKVVLDEVKVDRFLVDVFLKSYRHAPSRIVVDLDATDDALHGQQEGRFFHGFYRQYCYLPLYIFCGEFLLAARLRRSNIDVADGAVEELERIVQQIRQKWPQVQIIIRADSGFAREELMSWCEQHHVQFVLGLAKNERLKEMVQAALEQARQQYEQTGRSARVFVEFPYQTLKTWSRARHVIAKAEHLEKGPNPRFIVTSLTARSAQALYEGLYCARGEMENRIKEQQLFLFADRTSAATMRANQIRLWFSSVAYRLMALLRRLGLKGTELARAQCNTIREKLLKIGAHIRISVRRVLISLASAYPYAHIFARAYSNLRR